MSQEANWIEEWQWLMFWEQSKKGRQVLYVIPWILSSPSFFLQLDCLYNFDALCMGFRHVKNEQPLNISQEWNKKRTIIPMAWSHQKPRLGVSGIFYVTLNKVLIRMQSGLDSCCPANFATIIFGSRYVYLLWLGLVWQTQTCGKAPLLNTWCMRFETPKYSSHVRIKSRRLLLEPHSVVHEDSVVKKVGHKNIVTGHSSQWQYSSPLLSVI